MLKSDPHGSLRGMHARLFKPILAVDTIGLATDLTRPGGRDKKCTAGILRNRHVTRFLYPNEFDPSTLVGQWGLQGCDALARNVSKTLANSSSVIRSVFARISGVAAHSCGPGLATFTRMASVCARTSTPRTLPRCSQLAETGN